MTTTMTRQKKKKVKKQPQKRRSRRTAATSDKHELYEQSVQNPEGEGDFIDQVWKERRRRLARHIREDFCGTAIASVEWIKRRKTNTAVAVDIDADVLAWARARLPERLDDEQRTRLTLRQADVHTVRTEPVDSILAMNFSYYLFKTREALGHYFRRAHHALIDDGIFLLDAYGGSDSFLEIKEKRRVEGFTYIWDQAAYNPITGDALNHIHYRFPDGSEIKKAFTYDWRLWTLPEIQELLLDAGFREVTVYWEGTDEETGEGDDKFTPTRRGEACQGWIAYLVAEK
ncbi:MAG: class I SAM-dependent methyltransferase [Planctomycetota bacterium]|jgi:SAM-dependent methyltransferase